MDAFNIFYVEGKTPVFFILICSGHELIS
uniref:Uncharacterized protein n=1 Tax=Anguilla anguilla TaxID=7936 RepID=A0A0E9UIB9_ANGAN